MSLAEGRPSVGSPVDLEANHLTTPFARRLRPLIEEAAVEGCGFVVAARSGAGKSFELDEVLAANPITRTHDGRTSAPIVRATLLSGSRTPKGFVALMAEWFGAIPPGSRDLLQSWLVRRMVACGTRLLVIDDAHRASATDLMIVKEIVDEVRFLDHERRLGFLFLCAGTAGTLPLQELINRPTLEWTQFRRRMSPVSPWRYVASLSADEVSEVLATYQHEVLAERFPDLRLVRWAGRIHRHLLHPFFDVERDGRATMQNLRNIVDRTQRGLDEAGLDDIPDDGSLVDRAVAQLLASPTTQVVTDVPALVIGGAP